MSRSFSSDLRVRVIRAVEEGLSTRKAAALFGVGVSAVGEWYRRYRDRGEIEACKQGPRLDALEAFILDLVDRTPDMALYEIAERPRDECAVSVCPATDWYFFDKRSITFQKRLRTPVSISARM